jgi:hypothetical protein
MAKASINIKNAKKIQNLLKQLPANLKQEALVLVRDEFKEASIQAKSIASAHDFTGRLTGGILFRQQEGKYLYQSTAPHAAYMEFGTRLGYTPRPGFERWAAQFKGGSSGGRRSAWDRILSWMIYRNIDEEYWWPVYRKLMTLGFLPINNAQGYFIGPYIQAKFRVIKGLSKLLKKSLKK